MSINIRELPLPVKVVVSVFLMAVGAGYTSAMVQLHMKDSKSGKPMPTVEDVVRKYTGKKRYDPNAPPPVSKFVQLVGAPRSAPWGANSSMVAAFFEKDNGDWDEAAANPAEVPKLTGEREGERAVTEAWGRADADARKTAYDKNAFTAKDAPAAITPKFKNADGTFKVKDIIDARCARCHKKGGSYSSAPLQTYADIEKYLKAPEQRKPKEGSEWVDAETPISIESLTQSTHAHLLSFAVLFSLTGLAFACTTYPTGMRCVLGPWVVLAVFADVSLWWLARLSPDWGPYFAMGIMMTGALAGAGLFAQITLTLFAMYGPKGKGVIGLLYVLGLVVIGLVWVAKIDPALKDKEKPPADATPAPVQVQPDPKKPKDKDTTPPISVPVGTGTSFPLENMLAHWKQRLGATTVPVVEQPPTELEHLLRPIRFMGIYDVPYPLLPWGGGELGNMARAFFDKEQKYKDALKEGVPQAVRDKMHTEREAERLALIAWIRLADADRKKAYDGDAFPLPKELAGKPVTPDYIRDGKLLVKKLIDERCARCHSPGSKQEDYPLTTYDEIRKYLVPPK